MTMSSLPLAAACGLAALSSTSSAFAPAPHTTAPPAASSTRLHIIGPMIKRMREKKAAENQPMYSADAMAKEAPGLKVGAGAWKWPPVWPYDSQFFQRKVEMEGNKGGAGALGALAGMGGMGGMGDMMAGATGSKEGEEEEGEEAKTFDSLGYWAENEGVATELDVRVSTKITNHYSFYLRDGMSVLELGAAEESYLPTDLKLNRHVGVGAVKSQMEANPSITESMVVDLNEVVEDEGVVGEDFRDLCQGGFDAVIMANTIDFLNHPREVFKSSWRALKPGGIMIVPFLTKDAYVDKFDEAFTKQWRDMSDDQHMWVCGSFFQFSAGDGWEGLIGFDISPEDAKEKDEGMLAKLKGGSDDSGPPGAFVVQARKQSEVDTVDDADSVEAYIKSQLWMMPTLEDRDKKLVAPRLARAYEALDSQDDQDRMIEHFNALPSVYASLIKMDQFAFTFSMQAQLAADLVGDPDFVGSDLQVNNLKMGLGLRRPSKEFWAPVGQLTSAMAPEDKVNLLAHIVPRFDSGDPAQDAALEAFVTGLEPTFEVVRSKCPSMAEEDVQLLGSELLASEVLKPGRSTREEFAVWLGALTEVDLEFILTKRKSFQIEAKQEMEEFVGAREAEKERVAKRREKIKEQVMAARETRKVIFNPTTGKMEEFENKEGGFKLPFMS